MPAAPRNLPNSETDTTNIDDFTGRFVVSYQPAGPNTATEEIFLRDHNVLDDFADTMNNYVRVPRDVHVVAKDCGESNAFYMPDEHSIEVCHELSAQERESFTEAGLSGIDLDTAVYQNVVVTLYHEAGHALISELELPITGREEDVADQMAAHILTNDHGSTSYLLSAAESYALAAGRIEIYDATAFSDTHSPDAQRAVNFLCYVYGSDESAFRYLVDEETLDHDRAEGCAEEYVQLTTAWDSLLAPYTRR